MPFDPSNRSGLIRRDPRNENGLIRKDRESGWAPGSRSFGTQEIGSGRSQGLVRSDAGFLSVEAIHIFHGLCGVHRFVGTLCKTIGIRGVIWIAADSDTAGYLDLVAFDPVWKTAGIGEFFGEHFQLIDRVIPYDRRELVTAKAEHRFVHRVVFKLANTARHFYGIRPDQIPELIGNPDDQEIAGIVSVTVVYLLKIVEIDE